jgi:hypothetical protein
LGGWARSACLPAPTHRGLATVDRLHRLGIADVERNAEALALLAIALALDAAAHATDVGPDHVHQLVLQGGAAQGSAELIVPGGWGHSAQPAHLRVVDLEFRHEAPLVAHVLGGAQLGPWQAA